MLVFKKTVRFFVFKDFLVFVGELGVAYVKLSCFMNKIQIRLNKNSLFVRIINNVSKNMRTKTMFLFAVKQKLSFLDKLFRQKLAVYGIGFRCWVFSIGKTFISLKLGYSNDFSIALPSCIKAVCLKASLILLKSYNLIKLNQYASLLSKLRSPDIYKGKGITCASKGFSLREGKSSK